MTRVSLPLNKLKLEASTRQQLRQQLKLSRCNSSLRTAIRNFSGAAAAAQTSTKKAGAFHWSPEAKFSDDDFISQPSRLDSMYGGVSDSTFGGSSSSNSSPYDAANAFGGGFPGMNHGSAMDSGFGAGAAAIPGNTLQQAHLRSNVLSDLGMSSDLGSTLDSDAPPVAICRQKATKRAQNLTRMVNLIDGRAAARGSDAAGNGAEESSNGRSTSTYPSPVFSSSSTSSFGQTATAETDSDGGFTTMYAGPAGDDHISITRLPNMHDVNFDRPYIRNLFNTYAPANPMHASSIGAAQEVCEGLSVLYRTGHYPDLLKHFLIDHMLETDPGKDLRAADISVLKRHGDRLLATIRGVKNKRANPNYLQDEKRILPILKALCGCMRLPNLLQLIVSNTGDSALDRISDISMHQPENAADGFAGASKNMSFDARMKMSRDVQEESDERVLPQSMVMRQQNVQLGGRTCTSAPPPVKLQERRCGDIHVKNWKVPENTWKQYGVTDRGGRRSILVSNLPFDVSESDLSGAFARFGEIQGLEIFCERQRNVRLTNKNQLVNSEDAAVSGKERVNENRFSSAYAIIEFSQESSAARASRDFFRIFGVLVSHKSEPAGGKLKNAAVSSMGGASKFGNKKPAAKSETPDNEDFKNSYPELAARKNTLLITGIPWQFPVGSVLREIGRALGRGCSDGTPSEISKEDAKSGNLELKLTNSSIFNYPISDTMGRKSSKKIEKLALNISHKGDFCEVIQEPSFEERHQEVSLDTFEDDSDPDLEEDEETFVADLQADIQDVLATKRYISEHHNDGIMILRFETYAESLLAKRILTGCEERADKDKVQDGAATQTQQPLRSPVTIGDRQLSVDFSPRRISFIQLDHKMLRFKNPETGEPEAGRFVDFMTPPVSAVYTDERDNPFFAFGFKN